MQKHNLTKDNLTENSVNTHRPELITPKQYKSIPITQMHIATEEILTPISVNTHRP